MRAVSLAALYDVAKRQSMVPTASALQRAAAHLLSAIGYRLCASLRDPRHAIGHYGFEKHYSLQNFSKET
jgi:hypothetical protein